MRSHIKGILASGAVVALATIGGVNPAHATTNGTYTSCAHYDETLCVFYNSGLAGSHIGIFGTVNYSLIPWTCPSDGCRAYNFITSGAGYSQPVKNNAGSVYNENPGSTYYVFYNSNQQGPDDYWAPEGLGTWYGNLNVTYNENASQQCTQCGPT
ncbi:hypothetical protein [Actinacidiphila paucisporea]|uniref:Peptidase inhibitor family I36 n=1 Tax=Actinacidiphila paucisporea TaxID=310782 RepID=A0A1M7PXT7_9ACTN|nr:hypothetical protein [Actinacidiphila paucisporea]SHN22540.1 hypothetical protein SAMN05216499_12714 [Actinacidiphila paucisporea]